jgi:hypothetical protein
MLLDFLNVNYPTTIMNLNVNYPTTIKNYLSRLYVFDEPYDKQSTFKILYPKMCRMGYEAFVVNAN